MNSLNSYISLSRLGIQAVCVNLLLSFSTSTDGSVVGAHDGSVVGVHEAMSRTPGMLSSADQTHVPAARVIHSTGAIEADVDLFRALLGGPNNGATPGEQPAGRREINWDGVPASLTNVPNFPIDFFNTNSPRGLVYGFTGNGLQVSDQSYIDINPAYAGEFIPFSGHKVFSPIGTIGTDVAFFVAGSNTPAAVRGIGVVFLDVDKIGSSGFELVGENGLDLGTFIAPVRSDRRGASFVGVVFRNPVITHVHIRTGDGVLAANQIDITSGGHNDLVVMDDIIYGEPMAIAP